MKRKITSEMMTTYFPSLLLTAITFATTFFKPFFFEAALSVNLSVMFVMSTLFVSVMEKLPQTSYVRMVDIWLIYGQLLPFIEVVLITYMESYRQPWRSQKLERIDADLSKKSNSNLKFTDQVHLKIIKNNQHTHYNAGLD